MQCRTVNKTRNCVCVITDHTKVVLARTRCARETVSSQLHIAQRCDAVLSHHSISDLQLGCVAADEALWMAEHLAARSSRTDTPRDHQLRLLFYQNWDLLRLIRQATLARWAPQHALPRQAR